MNIVFAWIDFKPILRNFDKICMLLLVFMGYSMNAKAILPGPDDYQCEISHLYFLDQNGIEIDTDFSIDVF